MPHVKLSRHDLYFAARGQARTSVIFIHGAGGSHLVWNGQLAAVSGVVRAIAIDLPGHGRSSGPGAEQIGEYSAVVAEFLDALALDRALVVGTSMGGAIAQTLALEYPHRIAGLGLVGTGARLKVLPAFLTGILDDYENTIRKINEAEFTGQADPRIMQLNLDGMRACGAHVLHDDFAACDAFDVRSRLEAIQAPTLVICGQEDRMTPLKYSEYLATQLAFARLEVIPAAGHMVMLEQPEAVNRALVQWLESLALHPAYL